MGRGRQDCDNGEETGTGQWRGEDGEGGNGKGETGGGQRGGGEEVGKRRGDFTYEMLGWTYGMPEWNEVTEFFYFVYLCNAGYPS